MHSRFTNTSLDVLQVCRRYGSYFCLLTVAEPFVMYLRAAMFIYSANMIGQWRNFHEKIIFFLLFSFCKRLMVQFAHPVSGFLENKSSELNDIIDTI